MTTKESERLARVEERQKNIEEKLDYLIQRFDGQAKDLEKKFVTRLESRAIATFLTMCIAVITFYFTITNNRG